MNCVLMFCPWTGAWKVGAPLAIYANVVYVYGRCQQGRMPRLLWICRLRGGVFVFSCSVMNYKCSCLKEHTVVWVESLSAPHSFRHWAQVWPGHMSGGCTDAPSGRWQNSSPGCRAGASVFLLAVAVGSSLTLSGFLYFLPPVCLQHSSLLTSLQQKSFILFAKNEF